MLPSRASATSNKEPLHQVEVDSYLNILSLNLGSAEYRSLAKPHKKAFL